MLSTSKQFIQAATQLGIIPITSHYLRLMLSRRLTETIVIGILIYGGQQILLHHTFFSPIWPASGVALSAIFLRGNFLLLGVALGTLLSYLHNHVPWILSLAHSGLEVSFIYLVKRLALRWIGAITFYTVRVAWQFMLLAAMMSGLHVWLHLELVKVVYPLFKFDFSYWYLGALGELNSILCLTPLCLIFDPFTTRRYFHRQAWRCWGYALLLLVAQIGYFFLPSLFCIALGIFTLLLLNRYALCFGQVPLTCTLLGIAVIYLGGNIIPLHLFDYQHPLWVVTTLITLLTLTASTSLLTATYYRTYPTPFR